MSAGCVLQRLHLSQHRVEGRLRTTVFESKTRDNWKKSASSRRLDFVGRLRTSAISPLMKASRKLDFVGWLRASATFSKRAPRGSQKSCPGTISSSNYINKLPIHRPQRPLLVIKKARPGRMVGETSGRLVADASLGVLTFWPKSAC